MSICDGCIHDYVCGLEDNHEEGIVSCADRIPKDVFEKQIQESCEDAISRQGDDRWLLHFGQNMAIPSVEPKTVLYSGDGYADGYMVYDMAECPNCGYEYEDGDKDWGLSFCPSCGQKLNWESEDKE